MLIINKLLKSWLFAYIIAVIGQQLLLALFNFTNWLPLQQSAQQLMQYYTLIFTIIFAYFLFDDALYIIVSMLIVIIQPTPMSLWLIALSLILIYFCRQLTIQSHELIGLLLSSTFIVILSIVILPLFDWQQSILIYVYQSIVDLPESTFKVIIVSLVFSLNTLFPNDANQLISQLMISSDMLILASASSTIFIISLSTLCLYMGAIKESLVQSLLVPAIQLINVLKYPIVLLIPLIVTLVLTLMSYYVMPLNNSIKSVFYGSSFFIAFIDGAQLNGGGIWGWTNVLTIYVILPMLLTWLLVYILDKMNWFKKVSMKLTRQIFQQ